MQQTRNIFFNLAFIFPLLAVPYTGFSDQLCIETPAGESFVFEINPDDSFRQVIESIEEHVEMIATETACTTGEFTDVTLSDTLSRPLRIHMTTASLPSAINLSKKMQSGARNYDARLTKSEIDDISFIVKTLANASLPKIKTVESSINKAGDRIDHVHPLRLLELIFSREELKVGIRNLQSRGWLWNRFITGTTEGLDEEDKKNNILPYLADFASNIHVDVNILLPLQQQGRWLQFVTTLIDIVPRAAGNDRYNQ